MVNKRLIQLAKECGNDLAPEIEPESDPKDTTHIVNNGTQPVITVLKNYLLLENIACTNSEGTVFEQYPHIYVSKDIERNEDHSPLKLTPYEWIGYFEERGLFLPSFALSCNILAELYKYKEELKEMRRVLFSYLNTGNGKCWHAQNTIVNWKTQQIIHYPRAVNYNMETDINTQQNTLKLNFQKNKFDNMLLEEALKKPIFKKYIMNLTGLQHPEILIEIGNTFGTPAKVMVYNGKEKLAAWLGCGMEYFYLKGNDDLVIENSARGVCLKIP